MIPMMGPQGYPRMPQMPMGMQPMGVMPPMGPMPGMPGMPGMAGVPLMPYPGSMPMPPQQPVAPIEQNILAEAKQALGEKLYAMVEKVDQENAAKITGMLLEIETSQLNNIIKDHEELIKWISEAKTVLNSSSGQSGQ